MEDVIRANGVTTNWCGGLGDTVGRGCDVIDGLQGSYLG